MTRFLTLRTRDVGGPVQTARVVDCDASVTPLAYALVPDDQVARDVSGFDVVLAIHGFNVSRPHGVGSLARLDAYLALPPNYLFFGVLWPGDFWLPVVDYPWEAAHAVTAGRNIAAYANRVFRSATSISLISHSLGGRVLLEAVQNLDRPAAQLCIAAGAVDRDSMDGQYLGAKENAGRISVLSSTADKVLRLAYPAGDFISDVLLWDNDSPWQIALGLKGPKPPILAPLVGKAIPDSLGYDHGDYFPPSEPPRKPPTDPKWSHSAGYMRRAVTGQPNVWS